MTELGISILSRPEQSMKALSLMFFIPLPRSTLVRDVQFINAYLPILDKLSPKVTLFRSQHALNTKSPNEETLGMVTFFKLMQLSNALLPIDSTPSPIMISVKPWQPLKAELPILFTLSGRSRSIRQRQLWKASSSIDVRDSFNLTE